MRAAVVDKYIKETHTNTHTHTHKNKHSIGQQSIHCYSLSVTSSSFLTTSVLVVACHFVKPTPLISRDQARSS
jgi:hypothetical protein